MTDSYWFADYDEDAASDSAMWQPFLSTGFCCLPLAVWFASKEDCEDFIANDVLTAVLDRD